MGWTNKNIITFINDRRTYSSDCTVGDKVVIANSAAIGHAVIADHVIIGGNCMFNNLQEFVKCQ